MLGIGTAVVRRAATWLSPGGTDARLSVLIYHRVHATVDPLFPSEVTASQFELQMALVRQLFNVLPLSEAIQRLARGQLPPRAACITFDDGYADNATLALPILRKHNLAATFFIATAYLNGGRMFNDTIIEAIRRSPHHKLDLQVFGLGQYDLGAGAPSDVIYAILRAVKYLPLGLREDTVAAIAAAVTAAPLPDDLMMTTAQVRELRAAGMEIGGHTARHPILAQLDRAHALAEIVAGKRWLEDVLEERISAFAYPNGKPGEDYLPAQAEWVREAGFDCAVSTQSGVATRTSDLFQLPRYTPWDIAPWKFGLRLLQNLRSA